jgi:dTDP-4-amino-4,6-dideoxygalactose transaminase
MDPRSSALAINGGRPVRAVRLPLHRPWFDGAEVDAVRAALDTGRVGGDGAIGRRLEQLIAEKLGARHVLLVNSCTAALEIAIMAAGLGPGDEVVVPSFTFVSTANAIVRAGATPVFADVELVTGNLDPAAIEAAVGPDTRAVMVVHYAGMACDMTRILAIAERHGLVVLEDAAHALGASYKGRALSTWGAMGCLSFHETKDLVCGEGGALVIRDDDRLAQTAEIIREKGTNRASFLRGERDKYTWVALGSSFALSEILGAVALEQFKKLDEIRRRKGACAAALLDRLAPYEPLIARPIVSDGSAPNWHLFAIRTDPAHRDWMIRALSAEGIGAAFHYVPLHSAPFAAQAQGIKAVDLPATDHLAASLIRLPIFASMTPADIDDIVVAVDKVVSSIGAAPL